MSTRAGEEAAALLAELRPTGDRHRQLPPRMSVLRAACPMCGELIELIADAAGSVRVKEATSGDGWKTYTVALTAAATGTHVHNF
jgi:hypothetical protein